jgi:hypothetical protein
MNGTAEKVVLLILDEYGKYEKSQRISKMLTQTEQNISQIRVRKLIINY